MQIILENITGSGELWLDIMRIICGNTAGKSMVDLGCHKAPYTPLLGFKNRTYVDIQNRPLDHIKEQENFIQSNAIDFLFTKHERFDVSICSDMIEHLTHEQGRALLNGMVFRSRKQVIFTPLGEHGINIDGHPDSHASGWTTDNFCGAWLNIVIPNFHPSLGIGAFFAILCEEEEKQRIYNEIKEKYVKD